MDSLGGKKVEKGIKMLQNVADLGLLAVLLICLFKFLVVFGSLEKGNTRT